MNAPPGGQANWLIDGKDGWGVELNSSFTDLWDVGHPLVTGVMSGVRVW